MICQINWSGLEPSLFEAYRDYFERRGWNINLVFEVKKGWERGVVYCEHSKGTFYADTKDLKPFISEDCKLEDFL